jgi:hypothetical protein
MNKIISGYLWAWKNIEAGTKSVKTLKKFYPDADIFINVDYDGDVDGYKNICEENKFIFSRNNFQLGYCGNFANVDVGRDCWPKEYTFEWIRGIYEACKKTDSKYFMILEEDDFVLNSISILNEDFSMAIHPTAPSASGRYRPNAIPTEYLLYINDKNGNPISDGYAAGGGVIFNREQFIKAWETHRDSFWSDYDYLKNINKIIGWADYTLQFIMQLNNFEIIQNHRLCEHWEVLDTWKTFEVVTGLKDIEEIRKL